MTVDNRPKLKFIDQYKKLKNMKPIPTQLGKGRDGNFYWIYYGGMGDYSFHPVQKWCQQAINLLMESGELKQTDDTATLSIYLDDGVRKATFKIYHLVLQTEL